ncbi:arylsulfatase [bacterium]|nr:arylsulfatase [bacterium]
MGLIVYKPRMRYKCYLFSYVALLMVVSVFSVQAAAKPNMIFILADDLGYGDLGSFGQQKIQTPFLDKMAKDGMRLTSFYAGSTVCAPSRCVLMTGLDTGHGFVRGNGKLNLRPDDFTVAELFKQQGYATGLIGKWGLGHEGSMGIPVKQGFDYSYGYLDQHHAHNFYPEFLVRNEERVKLRNVLYRQGKSYEAMGAGWAQKKVDYSHDLFAEEALQWVKKKAGEPFFLYLALTVPHANNEAGKNLGNGQEVPDHGIYTDLDWTEPNKGQAAMITRMDKDVGRLLALLTKLKIAEDTLVIFTSDNGHHKEGGNDPEFFDANGPLRGMKRDLYEGGIRVPTIAWWPGKIKPGSVSGHVGYFGDLMATAADLSGAKTPTNLQSISILPTLLGKAGKQSQHEYLYWEFHERVFKQAIRKGNWKAVRFNNDPMTLELYDVSKDLGETENLAAKNAKVVTVMNRLLKNHRKDEPLWPIRIAKPKAKKK